MGTEGNRGGLSAALFGKTRQAVLGLLFGHVGESFYLRQIVRATGAGQGAVQRELKNLSEAGIIQRTVRGHQTHYEANPDCPLFPELQSLMVKTAGIADVLRNALAPLSEGISLALIYGSVSSGQERPGSDIDLLIVGDVSFANVVSTLAGAQKTLAREVNPTVYPLAEFRRKLAEKHHFLSAVADGPKLFVVGDADEFERLAEKRLAD